MEWGIRVLLAFLHAFLFFPALSLFMEINGLPHHGLLILFFLFTQCVALVTKKGVAYFLIQFLSIIGSLRLIFRPFPNDLSYTEWIVQLWQEGHMEWSALFAQELTSFPTIIGMTLLLLLITLLTYATVHLKKPILSFLISFVYLLILHTFTIHDILWPMIQILDVGLFLLALNHIEIEASWRHFLKGVLVTGGLTTGLVSVSYWAMNHLRPAQEWVETRSYAYQRTLDDRGFFDWIELQTPGQGFRRTGFGLSHEVLGGPLQRDFTPLFQAYTDRPHYWKVMHRDVYTGQGWESAAENVSTFPIHEDLSFMQADVSNEEGMRTISHEWNETVDYIAFPYGWDALVMSEDTSDSQFFIEEYSSYHLVENENNIQGYTISYSSHFPSRLEEDRLREDDGWRQSAAQNIANHQSQGSFEGEIDTGYWLRHTFTEELQLPGDLPERVSELALELTEDLDSEYEKVRAIEEYLKETGGFRYSLRETEETPAGEDYVDYFLFETQVGYCDNFSTAMAVMLRAIDIPARWTIGFTPGSLQLDENEEEYYQVSNANAHSWVEVYFPSYGWIPFEPSPSFSQPMTHPEAEGTIEGQTFNFDEEEGMLDLEELEQDQDETEEEDEEPENNEEEEENEEDEDEEEDLGAITGSDNNNSTLPPFSIIGLLGITLSIVLFIFRYTFSTFIVKKLIQKKKLTINQACSVVLWLYERKRRREPSTTLQTYFNYWKPFVSKYESLFDQFVQLANEAFYAPDEVKSQFTSKQKAIVLDMLDAFKDVPQSTKEHRRKHSKPAREF